MAHDSNGRIYVDTQNGVGISIEEVRTVLSEAAGADLSRSSRINRWAKKKPLAIGDPSGYTAAAAIAINYGLYVPYFTTLRAAVNAIKNNDYSAAANYDPTKTPWAYEGLGVGNWARLLDFDGYYHNARQFAGAVTSDEAGQRLDFYHNPYIRSALSYDSAAIWADDIFHGHSSYMALMVTDATGAAFVSEAEATAISAYLTPPTSLYTNDIAISRRQAAGSDYTVNITACVILSSVDFNAGVDIDSVPSGWFVPVIPSRATIPFIIGQPLLNLVWDPTAPWDQETGNTVTFTWYAKPNGYYTMPSIILQAYKDGGSTTWLACEWTNVEVPYIEDLIDGVLCQYTMKFVAVINRTTKSCDLTVSATNDDYTVDYSSIYSQSYHTEADGGTILNGDAFFPSAGADLSGVFGSSRVGGTDYPFSVSV